MITANNEDDGYTPKPQAVGVAAVAIGSPCDIEHDRASMHMIMGIICNVADEVYPARVRMAAEEVMAVMSRRNKPNRAWGVRSLSVANTQSSATP
jgi:hypothetical protein